jgi:IS5 family transposase
MKNTTKTQYRIRNWREYNAALVNRGSLTFWIDENVAEHWITTELSGGRGASNHYSDLAITTVLTLMAVFHLRLRQAQGFTQSVLTMMGLALDVPEYTTLCRRRQRLEVDLGVVSSKEALHVLVDSTGVKIYGEGEWKVRQHGVSKRRTWRKVHFGVDRTSQQIVATLVTTNDVSDDEAFSELLEQVPGKIQRVSADGAYDKRKCYQALIERDAEAVIPPRRGAKIWRHGNQKRVPHPRDENLRHIRKHGRKHWKQQSGYHQRSLAETAVYRFKTIFGHTLGARLFESQTAEVCIRAAALNKMTQAGMPDTYRVI